MHTNTTSATRLFTAALLIAAGVSSARASLIAYDGFLVGSNPAAGEYSTGALSGANPTVNGFSGAWSSGSGSGTVQSDGLTYAGLTTTGGRIEAVGDGTRVGHTLTTPFTAASTGTYYISFLLRLEGDTAGAPYRAFELHNGGYDDNANRVFQLGLNNGDLSGSNGLFGARVNNNNSLKADLNSTNTNVNLYVLRLDLSASAGADSVTIWANPTSLGGAEPGSGSISISSFDLAFDRLSIASFGGFPVSLDELHIGSSYADVTPIPEPASAAALIGLVAVAAFATRRHRRVS
jgi:hypothetical protein